MPLRRLCRCILQRLLRMDQHEVRGLRTFEAQRLQLLGQQRGVGWRGADGWGGPCLGGMRCWRLLKVEAHDRFPKFSLVLVYQYISYWWMMCWILNGFILFQMIFCDELAQGRNLSPCRKCESVLLHIPSILDYLISNWQIPFTCWNLRQCLLEYPTFGPSARAKAKRVIERLPGSVWWTKDVYENDAAAALVNFKWRVSWSWRTGIPKSL